MTIRYTDLYLRRSYSLLQRELHPDTVFFLGDLFDGGREWATDRGGSWAREWKGYGEKYWLREYNRFGRIFFDHWNDGGSEPNPGQAGRKIIAGLPGNHDLGLGTGIQLAARERFNAYFGDGSRIDVIANHTFVSVDTVSLSAMDQPDPAGGSQGADLRTPAEIRSAIWKPVQDFLDQAKSEKSRVVQRHLNWLYNGTSGRKFEHTVTNTEIPGPPQPDPEQMGVPELPTILLTHIPLYRASGTPCGPDRERWPPSKPSSGESEPLTSDEPNAIAVRAGYQYQNVLTPEISKDLVEKIGNIGHVFSGDDHDYCDIVHREFTASSNGGRIREITVKSMSWAMGVRKPGFVMLSLWNPVDGAGNAITTEDTLPPATLQSHLCLLPDQLRIFTLYAALVLLTLATLLTRSIVKALNGTLPTASPAASPDGPLLPLVRPAAASAENEKATARHQRRRADSHKASDGSHSSNSSTCSSGNGAGLAVRSSAARTRSVSPVGSYAYGYGVPASQVRGYDRPDHDGSPNGVLRGFEHAARNAEHGWRRTVRAVAEDAFRSARQVGLLAGGWYVWLLWHG